MRPYTTVVYRDRSEYARARTQAFRIDPQCLLQCVNIGVVVEGESPGEELLAIEDGLKVKFSSTKCQRQFELWCVFSDVRIGSSK